MNDYITIPLSKTGKNKGKYETIISPEDRDLADLNWFVLFSRGQLYVMRKHAGQMHRIILERVLCRPLEEAETVDHINGDGLDNRRENLRLATQQQNSLNRKTRHDNSSGYTGVCWNKKLQKWFVQITFKGEKTYLGLFDDTESAKAAYDAKAVELFGKFKRNG